MKLVSYLALKGKKLYFYPSNLNVRRVVDLHEVIKLQLPLYHYKLYLK